MGPDDDSDTNVVWPACRAGNVLYERRGSAIVRRERLSSGRERITPLTNFSARIIRDLVVDDDVDQEHEFEIEAELNGCRVHFFVSAREFPHMAWVLTKLGPQAIIGESGRRRSRFRGERDQLSGMIPITVPG